MQLNQFLLAVYRSGSTAALLVDEAHLLSAELLEEIRLLSNFETAQHKLLQILLVGQPELDDILDSPYLRQLKQRVALRYKLEPLDETRSTATSIEGCNWRVRPEACWKFSPENSGPHRFLFPRNAAADQQHLRCRPGERIRPA